MVFSKTELIFYQDFLLLLIFFRSYVTVSTICDEYIIYWNNGMDISNQVNGNTRVRA